MNADELELITRVGPGTPMGELLRRYWFPAVLVEEVAEPDSDPRAIRLLGEDLVAFRDSDGRVGIMDVHCPHRLASLALGRNEEGGIRCIYHGWKIDVNGCILDTPCESPKSGIKQNVRHTAYATREAAGLVWVYMGPTEHEPPFPDFAWTRAPDDEVAVAKMVERCNFVQGLEGVLDSLHSNVLHSGYEFMGWTTEEIAERWKRPSRAFHGKIVTEDTDYGFHYASVREPTVDGDRLDYIRVTEFTFPFFCSPPRDIGLSSRPLIFVPIDDYSTMLYTVYASEPGVAQYGGFNFSEASARDATSGKIDKHAWRAQNKMRVGVDLDENYVPNDGQHNNYGQDRDVMRRRDTNVWYSFTGIGGGAQTQDRAMVETMGPISDRRKEHLTPSDLGIVRWRSRLVRAVTEFANGGGAPGIDPPAPYRYIRASSALVEKGSDWREVTWQRRDPAPTEESHATSNAVDPSAI